MEDRFNNPFVNHELMSISLNSTSKWQARNMPSFLEYIERERQLPTCLTMSFAAYIAFYSNDIQELIRAWSASAPRATSTPFPMTAMCWNSTMPTRMTQLPTLVHAVMTNEQMWGQDLTKVAGFEGSHRQEPDPDP